MNRPVLVVLGAGGMGEAIARRLGSGQAVVLGDVNPQVCERVASSLESAGFKVIAKTVDVSARASVRAFAEAAASVGPVMQVAHTAGLSPVQASADAILRVDLYGVAVVLEEFAAAVAPGAAGVVIASMAGHLARNVPADFEQAILKTPADELLRLPFLQASAVPDPGAAYSLSKRANGLLVMAASATWGAKRARINAISPGVIATSMGQQELAGPAGDRMRALVAASGTGRLGTENDIAEAAAFLLGPSASFITGVDLLVDGGVVARVRAG